MSTTHAHPDEVHGGARGVGEGRSLLLPREVPLGGPRAMRVQRSLPHRDIRTVGAWCFVDHFGPVRGGPAMHVAAHPHIGLQTVTWLLDGAVEHRDSVGSRRLVRPGELNIMTAGRGIAHTEDSVEQTDGGGPGPQDATQHGVQLWVALPDAARHQDPHFEHHDDLPLLDGDGMQVRVLVGEVAGARSAAAAYSPLVGAEVTLQRSETVAALPLEPAFEHAVLAVEGTVEVEGVGVPTSALLHLDPGRRELAVRGPGRFVLIGGAPFEEQLLMWWNFVGRDHDEIVAARQDWEAGRRFGAVDHPDPRLPAPALPTTRLQPRPGRRR